MTMREKRAALVAELRGLSDGVKSADADSMTRANELMRDIDELDKKIKAADEATATIAGIARVSTTSGGRTMTRKSLGDAAVEAVKDAGLKQGVSGRVSAKAATDTVTNPSNMQGEVRQDVYFDSTRRVYARDLFTQEPTDLNAITYFKATVTGAPAITTEDGKKPQFSVDPEPVTVPLTKVAGIIKESDELLDDYPRLAAAINERGVYEKDVVVENQLINGTGASGQVKGLLSTDGIGAVEYANGGNAGAIADAIFEATMTVLNNSGRDADGLIINPADYQALRTYKDTNGQYMGGGYFSAAYGNGTYTRYPDIWNLRTVVTPAIAAGTMIVGNFTAGASVITKGGTVVETGHDGEDFSHNRITVRVEERLALAVYEPKAFCKISEAEA